MTDPRSKTLLRLMLSGTALLTLAACAGGGFDGDLRGYGKGIFSTSDAALQATGQRPEPDSRGIISYPGYQVAVARQGDTVESVAARIGLPAADVASYNAVSPNATLHQNEVLALPRRVADAPTGGTIAGAPLGAAPSAAPGGGIDVTTLASSAITRAETAKPAAVTPLNPTAVPTGSEPIRHKVARGETAYTIAHLYNVNVRALADWNGLGSDLAVREGQILLIPVAQAKPLAAAPVTAPGQGSPTPVPPSAGKPVPAEKPVAITAPVKTPPAPDLGATASSKFSMPVSGKIVRGYQKKKNDGIDIAAAAGTPVKAAGDGVVAAITKDTQGVPILVVRHDGNLLSVYANLDAIAVKKGDRVKRGQALAKVRASDPAFVHFEIRQGFESVDPMPYLQ